MNSRASSKDSDLVEARVEKANERARQSLDAARRLREAGFPSAAYVWAVRSVEIFTKEFLLTPLYLDEARGDWVSALRKASKLFGSSNWDRAYARLEEVVGPIDQMLTETDENAWRHWRNNAVRIRGDIVHGRDEATDGDVDLVITYAEQLLRQLTLRMIESDKHPMHHIFSAKLAEAQALLRKEGEASDSP